MDTTIIIALIGAASVITASYIAYRKDVKIRQLQLERVELEATINKNNTIIQDREFKISTLDKLLDFQAFNQIKDSVDRIFQQTKAEQFLLYIAVNGKTDFRLVSVIFEQNQDNKYKINAIIRYRDVEIDDAYRKLIKDVEADGTVNIETAKMKPQLLKDFYTIEKIKFAQIRFLHREHLNDDDDVLLFGSLATHANTDFTKLETAIIKSEYEGSIKSTIREFI